MLPITLLATGLVLAPISHYRLGAARTARVALCADSDAADMKMRVAAARVVRAAEAFGDSQGEAAIVWVREALAARGGDVDGSVLLEQQLVLFEECLLEESGKCKELDLALTQLEKELEVSAGPVGAFAHLFGQSKADRASARVRTAAAKFGTEQERIAEMWIAEMRANRALDPFALLEQQVALFGECMVDDDTNRCKELHEALAALQVSLGVRGKIVSTGGLMSK